MGPDQFGEEPRRPSVHSVPYGSPRIPDGDVVPHCPVEPRPCVTRRQLVYGWVIVVIVIAAAIFGTLR